MTTWHKAIICFDVAAAILCSIAGDWTMAAVCVVNAIVVAGI